MGDERLAVEIGMEVDSGEIANEHTLLLHPECIGGLCVKICCILPLLCPSAKHTEAAAGTRRRLVGLSKKCEKESR